MKEDDGPMDETIPQNKKIFAPDWWLFGAVLALVALGLVLVYDASYAYALDAKKIGDPLFFIKRQGFAAILGLASLFGAMRLPYWKTSKVAVVSFVIALILLALTLKFGVVVNASRRWLKIGPIQLQPSEIVKLATILLLANLLSTRRWIVRNLWSGVAVLFGICAVPMFLIERQPDLGTAFTLFLTVFTMLFVGGVKRRWLAGIVAVCLVAVAAATLHKGVGGERVGRFVAFLNPVETRRGDGFQVYHSTVALGSGGATGRGLGESREKRMGGLPEAHTDFIFAIVGEETGWIGSVVLLGLFCLVGARGFTIACESRDPYGQLLAAGITTMVVGQAVVNVAVVTASMPATGVPLPFLSYGGTALISNLVAMGILLNISRHPHQGSVGPKAPKKRLADEFLKRAAGG